MYLNSFAYEFQHTKYGKNKNQQQQQQQQQLRIRIINVEIPWKNSTSIYCTQ